MLGNVPMLRAGDVLLVAFTDQQPEDAMQAFVEGVSALAARGPEDSGGGAGDE